MTRGFVEYMAFWWRVCQEEISKFWESRDLEFWVDGAGGM